MRTVADHVTIAVQRVRLLESLEQHAQAAEAADVAKSQFLASMSHELRTPMNAILGMTDLALSEQLPATIRDYLQTAKESADLLLELLNEILDFSRIEAGRFELEHAPFNLPQAIEQVVKTLGIRAYEKGLELVYDLPADLPEHVVGDALRMRQVLMNLIGNSIKFTSKGEVVVRAEVEEGLGIGDQGLDVGSRTLPACLPPILDPQSPIPLPPDPCLETVTIRFSVSDTGIGIAPEDQKRIFSPFTQADASTTRRYGGTGLGLAIAHRLVTLMGGRIWLESQRGEGSTFYFTLTFPLQKHPPGAEETVLPERAAFQDMPVLVVGENATSRRILQQMLASWSMRPETAPDVGTALTLIHRAASAGHPYRLVLADAVMPGIDGFTLATWLQGDPKLTGAVVLMLAAMDRQTHSQQCGKLRAEYLEKPFSRSGLFKTVAQSLGVGGQTAGSAAKHASVPPAAPARLLRILLAEDTPANQKLVLHVLGKRGHQLEIAENGRQAVDLLGRQPFDAVLMDVQMPVMDGFQATAAIRKLSDSTKAHVPIIAMTAHALKGDRERCLAAGMNAYVSKPIQREELIEVVERLAAKAEGVRPSGSCPAEGEDIQPPIPNPQSPTPDSLPFSLDEAMMRLSGESGLFREMAGFFFSDGLKLLTEIQAAAGAGDATAVEKKAHRLKGTVLYLGAQAAREAIARVEALGRSGDLTDAAEAIRCMETELTRLAEALRPYGPAEE